MDRHRVAVAIALAVSVTAGAGLVAGAGVYMCGQGFWGVGLFYLTIGSVLAASGWVIGWLIFQTTRHQKVG